MKTYLFLAICAVGLTGCETLVTPDGRKRVILTPMAAGIVQGAISTGIGAGTGALMNNSPGVLTGAVAGAAGSAGSQLLGALIPTRENTPIEFHSQRPSAQQPVQQPVYRTAPVQYQQPVRQMPRQQYQQPTQQYQQQPNQQYQQTQVIPLQ